MSGASGASPCEVAERLRIAADCLNKDAMKLRPEHGAAQRELEQYVAFAVPALEQCGRLICLALENGWLDSADELRDAIAEIQSGHVASSKSYLNYRAFVAAERWLIARDDTLAQTGKQIRAVGGWPLHSVTVIKALARMIEQNQQTTNRRRSRRGRKKADCETEQRESQLVAGWQRARDAEVYKADFAKQHDMTLKEFDRLLSRVRKRKSRPAKK